MGMPDNLLDQENTRLRQLLRRYMAHVMSCEGISFVEQGGHMTHGLTEAERAALREIEASLPSKTDDTEPYVVEAKP